MENESLSPHTEPATLPATRHDGWTGDKMAVFLETLADTAVVAEACVEARMSLPGGAQNAPSPRTLGTFARSYAGGMASTEVARS